MKENKKRIIVWGCICLFFIILSVVGISSHKAGRGRYGNISTKLEPIKTSFNSLHEVIVLSDMKAEVKGNKIVVSYINKDNKKEKYEYTYYNENGMEYIVNTYENSTGELVAKQMVNAVYRKNGGTDSIYKIYEYTEFAKATIADGINLTNKTISINLNKNLAVSLKGKIKSLQDDNYIKDSDLANIKEELEISKTVTKEIDDIKLYVMDNETTYDIYVSYTDDNKERSLKSLGNAVKALNPTVYSKLTLSADGVPTFDSTSTDYKFTEEANIISITYYSIEDIVFKVEHKKDVQ